MAMTRAALFSAVVAELGPVFRLCSSDLNASDTVGDLKESVDQVFRRLGVEDADLAAATVTTGSEAQAIAYLRYLILQRLLLILSLRDPVPAQLSAVQALFTAAEEKATTFGWIDLQPIAYAGGIDAADYDANQLLENDKYFHSSDLNRNRYVDSEYC